jgi:ABC-type Fe3+-hydroxamate transport system substrate-binding protein
MALNLSVWKIALPLLILHWNKKKSTYTEILVGKILKLKPDVLLVGRSMSRKAQELLLRQKKVVLLQRVKSFLMRPILRQTGATIIAIGAQRIAAYRNGLS